MHTAMIVPEERYFNLRWR